MRRERKRYEFAHVCLRNWNADAVGFAQPRSCSIKSVKMSLNCASVYGGCGADRRSTSARQHAVSKRTWDDVLSGMRAERSRESDETR